VAAYDEYYASTVQPFIDNARKAKETTQIVRSVGIFACVLSEIVFCLQADWTEQAFKHQRAVILAAGNCKKPSQDVLMKFVQPISEVIGTADSKVCCCS
jgi:hypothetical protein